MSPDDGDVDVLVREGMTAVPLRTGEATPWHSAARAGTLRVKMSQNSEDVEGAVPGRAGGFGTRPRCWFVCLWRRHLASRHCTF